MAAPALNGPHRLRVASAVAALWLAVAGCSSSTVSAPARTPAPTPAPTPTASSASGCTAQLVLNQVRELFAGQDFEAHYLTIGSQFTISVWLVDLEIEPSSTSAEVVAAGREARTRGLETAYEVVDRVPCTRSVFDQVNPMIVDFDHRHWYKDFLPVSAFVGLNDPTPDELVAAVEASGTALETPRAVAPQAAGTAAAGSCDWADARTAIHASLGGEDNTAAYLIIGARLVDQDTAAPGAPDDVDVEVQWPVHGAGEATDPAIAERLGPVVQAVACLSPAVDSLEAFVVDATGRTVVYAIVPGRVIRARPPSLPWQSVRFYHFAVPSGDAGT